MSSKKKTEKRARGEGYSKWISSWLESAASSFNATKSFMMSLKIPGKSIQTIVFEIKTPCGCVKKNEKKNAPNSHDRLCSSRTFFACKCNRTNKYVQN